MNHIFDANRGFICYPELCSTVAECISLEMTNPKVQQLSNLRLMTFVQLEHFNPMNPISGIIAAADDDPDEDSLADELSADKRSKPQAPKLHHYGFGKYEESTYYCQFLSDKLIQLPSRSNVTVHEMTEH